MFGIDSIKWSVLDYIWNIPFKVISVSSIASKGSIKVAGANETKDKLLQCFFNLVL